MTGALAVNAQGSPNMTVAVTAGKAYVTATPTGQASQLIRADIAAQNVTIASNATGSTRYDWIYVTINATNANTPNAAGDNVASITQSRSTSNVTDNGTPPTYGYHIATVTVVNGAASIANGSIADTRTQAGATPSSGSISNSQVATGFPVQVVSTAFAAVATGTTGIPSDDTIPQITEGDQYMTQAITPKASTNILVIEATVMLSSSSASQYLAAALFQDSTANALATSASFLATATGTTMITLTHTMTAGTTSATTFRIRGGGQSGTTTFNGASGGRLFGAITKSCIKITEYKV